MLRSDFSSTACFQRAFGNAKWPAGHLSGHRRFSFDPPLARQGYSWWYFDASSQDGCWQLAVIALVGNVFSPFYKKARSHYPNTVNPWQFCALNVGIYGAESRWIYSENLGHADTHFFTIGKNSLHWQQPGILNIDLNDRTVPWGHRVQGNLQFFFNFTPFTDTAKQLDLDGKHLWWPVAPHGTIHAVLQHPKITFTGQAYHDMNWGAEPLENAFSAWHWQRHTTDNNTQIYYTVKTTKGITLHHAADYQVDGTVAPLASAKQTDFGRSCWGLQRQGYNLNQISSQRILEDTPFYTRTFLRQHNQHIIHEQLNLQRFQKPWVQRLLPFRLRRC